MPAEHAFHTSSLARISPATLLSMIMINSTLRGFDVTAVAAKTAGLTADVQGHSCNATHTKWLEFHVQMSDKYGRFYTLASVTGSLYVQMRI